MAIDPTFGRELLATFHVRAGRTDDGLKIIKEALAASADPALAYRLFILRRQAGDVEGAIAELRA